MHEANRAAEFDGSLQRAVFAERTYVVDHRGSRGDCGTHDGGLAGIDGYGHVDGSDDSLDYREDPVELFLLGHIGSTRTRRFTPDIDDGGTVPRHGRCLAQRSLVAGKPAAVRERVGCDVENPHHGRDVEFKRTERQHGVIVCRSR